MGYRYSLSCIMVFETYIPLKYCKEVYEPLLGKRHFVVKIGFNFMNVKMTRMDSKVSIHFCIYEDRADTNL
jgi:hypothetical protein